jgi:DNA mismatch repair protein MutL
MVIGHLNQTFIICQNQQELIIIDQHAAHEKVLYERLLDNLASGSVPSQQLLFHQTLELSPLETGIIQEHAALIAEIGFEVSAFGGKTFILTAAPAYLGAEEAPQALSDVITGLAQERIPDQGEIKAKLLAKIACHAAIKANQRLEPEEIKSLIGQLAQLKTPFCCPHGRPVLLRYSLSELNRQFQRNK